MRSGIFEQGVVPVEQRLLLCELVGAEQHRGRAIIGERNKEEYAPFFMPGVTVLVLTLILIVPFYVCISTP